MPPACANAYDLIWHSNRYYGHPNPLRREYVLNGGKPTAGHDPFEVRQYPVGTRPDPRWRPAVFDFGPHQSPNGIIEYRNGSAFGGALKGKLLLARYSAGTTSSP